MTNVYKDSLIMSYPSSINNLLVQQSWDMMGTRFFNTIIDIVYW